jgi:superfamily I DNA/RNA helicase
LDDLLGSGFNGENIVLLSPYSDDPVSRTLAQSPRWQNRFAAYPAGKGKIGVCTIHAFKGLESPAIVLTSIDNLGGSNRIDLLYVGMSRALHRLHIFAHRSIRANLERNLNED